jgi:hypothetical protein
MDMIDSTKVVVTPFSNMISDTYVTYTISFIIGNTISVGGYIYLTIPSALQLS